MALVEQILLVEDDDDIREVVGEALVSEGYRVEVAKDGIDALGRLDADGRPPLILLDMMMPRMDGETFLRVLRRRPAMASVPVVIISGNAAAREKASALQAAACLVKPFELDELLGVVRRFIKSSNQQTV